MKNIFSICLIFFLATISSCQQDYNEDFCTELSFKAFKGSPKALNKLNKNCQDIKLKYTKEYCQKILTKYILTGDQASIVREFGVKAPLCLTEGDKQQFKKK